MSVALTKRLDYLQDSDQSVNHQERRAVPVVGLFVIASNAVDDLFLLFRKTVHKPASSMTWSSYCESTSSCVPTARCKLEDGIG